MLQIMTNVIFENEYLCGLGHETFKRISVRQEIEKDFGVQYGIWGLNYIKIRREKSTTYFEKESLKISEKEMGR